MFVNSLGLDGALGESQNAFDGVYEHEYGLGVDGSMSKCNLLIIGLELNNLSACKQL